MTETSEHQRRVRRALEGNEGVWFHSSKERIAVWSGGATINIYDSRTWEQLNTRETGVAYRTNDTETIRNAVEVTLGKRGYDRLGRIEKST